MKKTYFLLLFLFTITTITAQSSYKEIDAQTLQKALSGQTENGYQTEDLSNWKIQSDASSLNKDVWYYYLVQTHNGVEVKNALANLNVNKGVAEVNTLQFVKNIASKANSSTPSIDAKEAVIKALDYLKIKSDSDLRVLDKAQNKVVFSEIDVTRSDVNVTLVYDVSEDDKVKLSWNVNLDLKNQAHWWNIRIDAQNGQYLSKNDWTVSCSFGESKTEHIAHTKKTKAKEFDFFKQDVKLGNSVASSIMAPSYRVLPYYVESPIHGDFELVVNPADPTASPNGWHNDGSSTTETRGNNVKAYDDSSNPTNNGPETVQSSAGLIFDYPYGGTGVAASTYIDSAVTNLFYMSNIVHDVYYLYGFDEASGNFQEQNYGLGGSGSDSVNAEAQDGGGTNNANFSTPTDGGNGRMQMYLWDYGAYNADTPVFEVNNTSLAGEYAVSNNGFDPGHVPVTSTITANLVLVNDGSGPDATDGCETITNDLTGKIAVVRRGNCNFTAKAINAQNQGAVACLIVNNAAGGAPGMAGADAAVSIPTFSISQDDGEALIAEMGSNTVNASFNLQPTYVNTDGDYDNGVIAHEYGHGINIRLVGGPGNSSCVQANESMGEGWGDFIGKILLLKNLDNGIAFSGTGTFVAGQAPDGIGIRPAPYSGDIANNPMTYETLRADTTNATYTIPHGVGSVWAGMLWDLTWDLIAIHGFNPNIYDVNGTEGNIVALKLIVEGMKQTTCNPGFVNGRDAILAADVTLFGGANQCAIWGAFARRGLGQGASQGSNNSTSDGSHSYVNPASCSPSYLLTIGGPEEACEGASVDFDMVFNAQNGYNFPTGFAASGQPGGSTVTFSPTLISDTGLVTMNVSNLAPGNHTITVTPGGNASKNLVLNITVHPTNPVVGDGDTQYSVNSGSYTTFNDGATVTIAPGDDLGLNLPTSFAGSLLWTSPNGTQYTTDTVNFSSVVDGNTAVEGAWTVVALFDNECSNSSETVNFTVVIDPTLLAVNENEFDNLSVYPNPTNGMLNIGSSNNLDNAKVSVFDIAGRVLNNSVSAKHNSGNELSLNMSQLASGVYFVTIEDKDHKSTKKIIKE